MPPCLSAKVRKFLRFSGNRSNHGRSVWDSSHPWIRGEIEGFVGALGRLHRTAMTRCSYRPAGRAALAAQPQSEVLMRRLKQSRIRPCAFEPFIRTSLGCSACEEDESSTPSTYKHASTPPANLQPSDKGLGQSAVDLDNPTRFGLQPRNEELLLRHRNPGWETCSVRARARFTGRSHSGPASSEKKREHT